MARPIFRTEPRRRWADKYDRRDGPPVPFSAAERDYAIDMELGSRALVKSILATGRTHSPLSVAQLRELKVSGLL